MAAQPFVSVVMPVYNREALVGRAIESVLCQTFADFEFLVIDDGSTDRTAQVVREFSDARIRFFPLPVNCGATTARNVGIRLAAGEFLATMDSDDVSAPTRFEKQVAFLRANPPIDILSTRSAKIQAGQRLETQHPPDDASIKARLLMLDGSSMFHGSVMFRAAFLKRTGLLYPHEKTDEDHALWIEAMVRGARFAGLQDCLYDYYRHETNATTDTNPGFAGHECRKTPLRARLLGHFYPALTHEEAMAIAILMEQGRQHTVIDLSLALAALRKAGQETRSCFGESKRELASILKHHSERALRALQGSAIPSKG